MISNNTKTTSTIEPNYKIMCINRKENEKE